MGLFRLLCALRVAVACGLAGVTVTALSQTICVDPGHPSENGVGTHGKHISEIHAAWVVAANLRTFLQRAGYRVVLTKLSENENVSNKRRAEIANGAHASLMIRLHCDAGTTPGFASYYPAAVGHVGAVSGPPKAVRTESKRLALRFHPVVIEALAGKMSDRGLHTDADTFIGGKQGGALTGSIYSKVPVILVEMAVLQNEHDDLFIASAKGREAIASAIAEGIEAAVPPNRSRSSSRLSLNKSEPCQRPVR